MKSTIYASPERPARLCATAVWALALKQVESEKAAPKAVIKYMQVASNGDWPGCSLRLLLRVALCLC